MNDCKGCVHAGETHWSNQMYATRQWSRKFLRGALPGNCRFCCRNGKNKGKGYDHYQSKIDVAKLCARKRGWGQGAKDNGRNRPGPPHPTRREKKLLKRAKRT